MTDSSPYPLSTGTTVEPYVSTVQVKPGDYPIYDTQGRLTGVRPMTDAEWERFWPNEFALRQLNDAVNQLVLDALGGF